MMRRTPPALALATIAVAMLATGCTPTPEPTPTPTGFASEEEAFAAAEETYRAYVDALNEVDFADPATFEPMYSYLAGDFLEDTRRRYSEMHAEQYVTTGDAMLTLVEVRSASTVDRAALAACLDVREVEVVNAKGESVVPVDSLDVQPLHVELQSDGAAWEIVRVATRTGDPPCD